MAHNNQAPDRWDLRNDLVKPEYPKPNHDRGVCDRAGTRLGEIQVLKVGRYMVSGEAVIHVLQVVTSLVVVFQYETNSPEGKVRC